MAERAQFPPAPVKSRLTTPDFTMTLQWLAWFGALTTWLQRVRVYTFDVDVPSIPSGSRWWADYAIPGAAAGDFATASLDPSDGDLIITAQVRAANTVRINVENVSGAAIDLAAGSVRFRLEKAR